MRDRVLILFLVHEQSASRAVVRTLNHAIATAIRQSFKLMQGLVRNSFVARASCTHGTNAQDARQLFITIGNGNCQAMTERLFGQLELSEGGVVIGLILRHLAKSLRFLQIVRFGMSDCGRFQKIFIGFGVISLANKGHRLLHAVGETIGFVMSEADGFFVFCAGLLLIAHERVSIGEAEL